jgi:hypothetical protein
VAGTIALSISTFYDVQYGVFFVVYPLMLLSLVPVFNRHGAAVCVQRGGTASKWQSSAICRSGR